MNTYCRACENILFDAEYMFQDRSHNYAKGQFNKADKWLYNAVDVNPCHLCALLLDRSQWSVISRLVKDGRRETSYKLVSNRSGDESSLFSTTLDILICSESEPDLGFLSHRIIAFREGLLSLYIQLSRRCLQSW
jgi:hypothetical protein